MEALNKYGRTNGRGGSQFNLGNSQWRQERGGVEEAWSTFFAHLFAVRLDKIKNHFAGSYFRSLISASIEL